MKRHKQTRETENILLLFYEFITPRKNEVYKPMRKSLQSSEIEVRFLSWCEEAKRFRKYFLSKWIYGVSFIIHLCFTEKHLWALSEKIIYWLILLRCFWNLLLWLFPWISWFHSQISSKSLHVKYCSENCMLRGTRRVMGNRKWFGCDCILIDISLLLTKKVKRLFMII